MSHDVESKEVNCNYLWRTKQITLITCKTESKNEILATVVNWMIL